MKINKSTVFLSFLILFTASLLAQSSDQAKVDAIRKMDALLTVINYAYVDKINDEKMMEDAIVGMLKELDPHSVYIPKEELEKMNEPLEGNFEGVGIQFNIFKDTLLVVSPISGGPSEKLGILSGDKIIKIDGENVAGVGLKNSDVQKKLRGEKGTIVNVEIKRGRADELISFDIKRDEIPIYSIDASYLATPQTAYIKINRFARNTVDEFHLAIDSLKKQGAENLILDLRGNGGGYLQTAYLLADEFLEQGKMIVYTQGDKQRREEYKATSRGDFEKGKLIVLIDEGSASASEIVSGAVQDWDRGMIIGRRSFGKGLVQKPFPLPDGSAVRLTTARYYTPTGRSIQRPYDEGKDDYYKEIERRYKSGQLVSAENISFPDSLKYYTPNKRVVYGGGGIMPDIFVPLDTTTATEYYRDLVRSGAFNEFLLNYLDKNRKELTKSYPYFSDYKKSFVLTEDFMQDFIDFGEKKKVLMVEEDYLSSERIIKLQLKALLARNLYNSSAYFEIINELNDSYLEALNVIQSDIYEKAKLEND